MVFLKLDRMEREGYAGSSKSGTRSKPQIELSTSTQDVSEVQLPIISPTLNQVPTVKNTVANTPLFGNIGMQDWSNKSTSRSFQRIRFTEIEQHRKCRPCIWTFWRLNINKVFGGRQFTPSITIFQRDMSSSET